jgi:hypothetical protein
MLLLSVGNESMLTMFLILLIRPAISALWGRRPVYFNDDDTTGEIAVVFKAFRELPRKLNKK